MDTLSKLFGSELRVKMMRLFLFNPKSSFGLDQIERKAQAKKREVARELEFLKKAGIVKKRKGAPLYALDESFEFTEALSAFLLSTHSPERKDIVRRLEKAGRIKAVLLAGTFMNDLEGRVDLLVVGDKVRPGHLDRIVKGIESDMGKDIRYVLLSGADFAYRLGMNDKLVRDILDFPHEALVDKLGISRA